MGGLETIFLAAMIVFLVYVDMMASPGHLWQVPLLLLIIALTRPEGVIVFVVWFVYRFWTGRSHRHTIIEALVFVIPFSAFILWRWLTYGYPLSNTAYLKLSPSEVSILGAGSYRNPPLI